MITAHFKIILLTAALSMGVSTGNAATLNPGGSTIVTGTTEASSPELAGTVINDNLINGPNVEQIPGNAVFVANFDVQNRVVRSDLDGTLIFAPRILFGFNIALSPFLIDSFTLTGFAGFDTDVAYRTDGPGDRGPTFAERSLSGDALDFTFGFPLFVNNLVAGPAQESYFTSIKTNAIAFENTGRLSIFGRWQGDAPGTVRIDYTGLAVPVPAPVPLPASIVFLLGSFGVLLGLRRPRRPA